jgi:hypothetical protein
MVIGIIHLLLYSSFAILIVVSSSCCILFNPLVCSTCASLIILLLCCLIFSPSAFHIAFVIRLLLCSTHYPLVMFDRQRAGRSVLVLSVSSSYCIAPSCLVLLLLAYFIWPLIIASSFSYSTSCPLDMFDVSCDPSRVRLLALFVCLIVALWTLELESYPLVIFPPLVVLAYLSGNP